MHGIVFRVFGRSAVRAAGRGVKTKKETKIVTENSETKEILLNLIKKALKKLYCVDGELLNIQDSTLNRAQKHVAERCVAFKFGVYFGEQMKDSSSCMSNYNLDAEYNRHIHDVKALPEFENGCIPDLVLHKRHTDELNCAVFEFKGWWNPNWSKDKKKVKALVSPEGKYRYKYGFVILFGKTYEECKIELIDRGMEWARQTL